MDNGLASQIWKVRAWLLFFMVALVASGLTAFPLETEMEWVTSVMGLPRDAQPEEYKGLQHWLLVVRDGVRETNARFPFMAYGTDWLAFAHVVIAIFFIGPLVDPVKNRWVIEAGMVACALVPVCALVCGPIRGIPWGWRLIDCSFGIVGLIPLWMAHVNMRALARLNAASGTG